MLTQTHCIADSRNHRGEVGDTLGEVTHPGEASHTGQERLPGSGSIRKNTERRVDPGWLEDVR